jgi:adenine-specific DNA methylase
LHQAAKPSYFGGKTSLTNWIQFHLSEYVPVSQWPRMTFIDAFSGGGAMGMWAKFQGFGNVVVNDASARSIAIGHALLANQHCTLSRRDLWYCR